MKVLHLRASNFYGGPERQIHQHARRAAADGFDVIVASFSEQGQQPDFLTPIAEDGVRTFCFDVRSAYDRSAITKLRSFLTQHKVSILCTHDYRSNITGWLANLRLSLPWIAFSRGTTRENLKVRFYFWLDRKAIRRADRVVAVSGAQSDWLKRRGVPPEKIVVILNAIDPNLFEAIPAVDLRKQFGWQNETVVGLAAGRFSSEKGQSFLIDAAAAVTREHPQLRLVLYGDGPDLEQLRSKTKQLGIDDKVAMPGHINGAIGQIKGADFIVNPSLSEGLPNVVLEAMAVRKPVLATDVGGVPEIIEHGRTGWLVPPARADTLAEGLRFMLDNEDKTNILAQNGLEFVTSRCSFERQNELLCRLYQTLTAQ